MISESRNDAVNSGMVNIETKIRQSGGNTQSAVKWLYSLAPSLRSAGVPDNAFSPRHGVSAFIGGMFLYTYDPKTKDTLPWYDELPVVIPIEIYSDGWLGANVHYLPPTARMKLLDKLIEYKQSAHTARAYMNVSYKLLKGAVQTKLFEPCIHRYLASHVTSRIIRISDEYWDKVAMLPLARFKKSSASSVWSNSR